MYKEIVRYIKEKRKQGLTDNEIKKRLIKVKWSNEIIEKSFKKASSKKILNPKNIFIMIIALGIIFILFGLFLFLNNQLNNQTINKTQNTNISINKSEINISEELNLSTNITKNNNLTNNNSNNQENQINISSEENNNENNSNTEQSTTSQNRDSSSGNSGTSGSSSSNDHSDDSSDDSDEDSSIEDDDEEYEGSSPTLNIYEINITALNLSELPNQDNLTW